MAETPTNIVVCSCEDTMVLDAEGHRERLSRRRSNDGTTSLPDADRHASGTAIRSDGPLTIGCTQEAALFDEVADEAGRTAAITYANVRETAGWSRDGHDAGPKMAALLAAAAEALPAVPMVKLESEGVILVYGCDERAVEAGNLLKSQLNVTVLVKPPATIGPARTHRVSRRARARSGLPRATLVRSRSWLMTSRSRLPLRAANSPTRGRAMARNPNAT